MRFIASTVSAAAAALLLAGITACSNEKPQGATTDSTVTATPTTATASEPHLSSPIPPPPPGLESDSIPLRTPDGSPARFGLKSARIVQVYSGGMKGTRTILFDQYGLRERRDEISAPYPPGRKGPIQNSIVISTRDTFGRVDLNGKSGWKMHNSAITHYLSMDSSKNISLGESIFSKTPGIQLPDTVINGYHCKVRINKQPGIISTVWVWRGIPIREHFEAPMDSMEFWVETKEITPNINVPDSAFKFPAGIPVQDIPEPKPGQSFMPPPDRPAPSDQPGGGPMGGGPAGTPTPGAPRIPGQGPAPMGLPPIKQ
jgi:hypothetical protein